MTCITTCWFSPQAHIRIYRVKCRIPQCNRKTKRSRWHRFGIREHLQASPQLQAYAHLQLRSKQMILTDRRDLCYMSVQAMTRATTLVARAYSDCATAHTHEVSRRTVIRPYYNHRKTPKIYRIPVDVMRAKNSLSAGRLPTAYGAVGEGNGVEDQHSRLGEQVMSRL